jgi:hypothetical protein
VILKKKNYGSLATKILEYLSRLIFLIGILVSIFFFTILVYYFSSGLSDRYPFFSLIKKVDKVILQKYVGFSLYEIDDYLKNRIDVVKHLFIKNNLKNVSLVINQENLYNLEMQRQKKLGKLKNYEINLDNMSKAKMIFNDEIFRIKLRVKGDRMIHWYNKNETSFKIDIIGNNRFKGLEEFSIQKPITRNYIYEYIFHKLLENQNLISLKYLFVNLRINDDEKSIYAVEEGFSKELIERNKRRNGPIFGIDEDIGVTYPNILYDLYSKNYWINNHPELTERAFIKLNNLKNNNIEISEIFDLKEWAKYFAIIELTNGWHGAISKSVKLYYNPASGKFEPIGFDAHIIPNNQNNFILLDLIDENNKNCIGVCYDREWFLSFLKTNDGSLNNDFINLYIQELNKVISDSYINKFFKKYKKEIDYYNSQLNTENFKKDIGGMYKGIGNYVYNEKFILERISYLKERLDIINKINNLQIYKKDNLINFDNQGLFFFKKINEVCNQRTKVHYVSKNISIKYSDNCKYYIGDIKVKFNNSINISSNLENMYIDYNNFHKLKELELKDEVFYLNQNLIIDKNYVFPKNKTLIINKGVKIDFIDDFIFKSYGSIKFQGTKNEPILINNKGKKGSFILSNNDYLLKNVIINNLSYPKDKNRILHGGVNIINSNAKVLSVEIKNSKSEDAINFVSSDIYIEDLKIENILSDGIDVDFGNLKFDSIFCINIKNDCLDLSNSNFEGENLIARNVDDKGLSVGENSNGNIKNLLFEKNRLGIAVKDGSKLSVNQVKFLDNQYDIAVFKKKEEYESASLKIDNISEYNNSKIYLGKENSILSNHILKINKVNNNYLNNIFY